jgi:hypothetical protein
MAEQKENEPIAQARDAAERLSTGYTPLEKAGAASALILAGAASAVGANSLAEDFQAKHDLQVVAEINRDAGNVAVAEKAEDAADGTFLGATTKVEIDAVKDVLGAPESNFPNTSQPDYYAGLTTAYLNTAEQHVDKSEASFAASLVGGVAAAGIAGAVEQSRRKKEEADDDSGEQTKDS